MTSANPEPSRQTEDAQSRRLQRVVRCVAWIALAWGITGGWQILGQWWPQLNTVTKDQITIIIALAVLWGRRK
jgi:hypothetical protein